MGYKNNAYAFNLEFGDIEMLPQEATIMDKACVGPPVPHSIMTWKRKVGLSVRETVRRESMCETDWRRSY